MNENHSQNEPTASDLFRRTVEDSALGARDPDGDLDRTIAESLVGPLGRGVARAVMDPLKMCQTKSERFDQQAFEAAVTLMIASALAYAMPKFGAKPDAWKDVASHVADSLIEDPIQGPKLRLFWEKLGRPVPTE